MYAETGLLYPYYHQGCSQEIQFQHCFQGTNGRGNPFQTSSVSEYDLGGEGDLFKAPEPLAAIVEEPLLDLDPMFASILSVEDDMPPHSIQIADMAPVQNDPLFSVDFYECKKELLAKSAIKESLAEVSEVKLPAVHMEEVFCAEKDKVLEGAMQKSVSSSCLTSMEWVNGGPVRPNFLDFQGFDLGAALGLRRAHSEGDIRTLGSVNTPVLHPPLERVPTEDREQKLLRYRNKKTKRNFGRKIKYACRKALADSQPRVRGRFARSEEAEGSHTIK